MPFDTIEITWNILSALIVLVLPGAALLVWFPGKNENFGERLADAVGLSVAITTLFGLAAFYLNLSWVNEAFLNWAALGFLILFITGLLVRLPGLSKRSLSRGWLPLTASLLGLLALVGLIMWRFYQARNLALPGWVDSVHHTLIVKIIMEKGGLPATLDPYIPAFFSYHYGFHLLAALFSTWSRALPADTLLWFGQIINALVALSVYRLGKTIWQDARPAVLAAVLVGFSFQMPAYYVTWGRYTLLTGLLLLPLAMAAAIQVRQGQTRPGDWLRLILLSAGVALSHYTALLLLGFFMILMLAGGLIGNMVARRRGIAESVDIVENPSAKPAGKQTILEGLWQPALASLLGVLLATPWLLRVWQQDGYQANVRVISPLDANQLGYGRYILYLLGPLHNEILLGIAGVGLIIVFFRRSSRVVAAWGLLLALLTLPWGLRLGPFRPDHMAIVLFLPAALLIGELIFFLLDKLALLHKIWLRYGLQVILVLSVLGLAGWGAWNTRNVINSTTIFAYESDVEALKWIDRNTPEDAIFLINTALWMGSIYRGVDGGYWLLPYTGRQTVLPPVMYTSGSLNYMETINNLAERTSQLTTCDEAFRSLVQEAGVTFLYVHEGQGGLQPASLIGCSDLVPVYRRNGVYIYEIN